MQVPRCKVCGKITVVPMRRVRGRNGGYRLAFSRKKYCSNACRQYAYRRRKMYVTFRNNNP